MSNVFIVSNKTTIKLQVKNAICAFISETKILKWDIITICMSVGAKWLTAKT